MQVTQNTTRLVIVLDHREARIYKNIAPDAEAQSIIPLDAKGEHRYLHSVTRDDNGRRNPQDEHFYARIIQAIDHPDQILIFGHGHGGANAMQHLVDDLRKLQPKLADHVIGVHTLDIVHLTQPQLLAKARQVFDQYDAAQAANKQAKKHD